MKNNEMKRFDSPRGLRRRLLSAVACLMAATMLAPSAWALEAAASEILPEPGVAASPESTSAQPVPPSAEPESPPSESGSSEPESPPPEPDSSEPESTPPEPDSSEPESSSPESVPTPEEPEGMLPEAVSPLPELESGGVLLDESNFPDPAFLQCVQAFDTDGSGVLSEEECAAVTQLDIRGKGIVSLEGIGFFPELTYLNCIGNGITELPLEHLSKLTRLLCNENRITSLDLSQTPALELLHCHDNLLSSLDVSSLPHLRELACGDNPFSSLDVSRNPELQYLLYLGGPLRTLTLSGNDALIDLWCSYSLVSQLDLSQAPNLEILGIQRSDLCYFDLSANTHLTEVMAADNLLLALRAGQSIPNLDLSGQRAVEVQIAAEETSCDLARLGVPIDAACISDVTGAQLSGTVLTGISDGSVVTYRYTDNGVSFTATLSFHVSNAWLEPLTMEDWTYGEPAHLPHADAQYSQPTYLYSASPDGTFTSDVPTDAGTWYVKAVVPADPEHAGLEAVQEFHILKAQPAYTIPSGLSAVYGSTLGSIQPGTGFEWKTPAQLVGSVGTRSFTARFVPADTENYVTVEDIQIPVRVTPKQASDSWVSAVTNAQEAAALTVRDGETILREGVDYTLSTKESGGKVTITVTFLGNYTGTVLRSYSVSPSQPPAASGPSTATKPSATPQPTPQPGGNGSISVNPLPLKPPASSAAPSSPSSGNEQNKPPESTSSSSRPEPPADSGSSDAQTEGGTLIPQQSTWWPLLLFLVLLLVLLLLLLWNRRTPDDHPDDTE